MADRNYLKESYDDALDTIDHFDEETARQIDANGEASKDMYNDYPDGDAYHHETHTDHGYSLREAAELLEQLSDYEADDSGLWEGLEPRRAIEVMAAYTYSNAVYDQWMDLIDDLNEAAQDELHVSPGPKEWSPKGKPMTTLAFVKKFVKENRR